MVLSPEDSALSPEEQNSSAYGHTRVPQYLLPAHGFLFDRLMIVGDLARERGRGEELPHQHPDTGADQRDDPVAMPHPTSRSTVP